MLIIWQSFGMYVLLPARGQSIWAGFFVSIYTKASKFSFSLTSWNMWQEERSHVVSPCGVIIRLIHERKGKYLLEVSLISVTGGWQCRNDY
jgi:hypothetical protein